MSPAVTQDNKIRHIVRILQMLHRWRKNAASTSSLIAAAPVPSDVPAGHVAICVGSSCRRFVVRATYLNHPIFKTLLAQAEEEYGFENHGPLALPCDESVFEEILRVVSRAESTRTRNADESLRCSQVGRNGNLRESGALLREFPGGSVC